MLKDKKPKGAADRSSSVNNANPGNRSNPGNGTTQGNRANPGDRTNPGNRATPEKQSALLERATASNRKNPPAAESAGAVTKAKSRRAEDATKQNRKLVYVGFESALDFWRGDTRLGMYEDCIDPDGELSYCDGFDPSRATSRLADMGNLLESQSWHR